MTLLVRHPPPYPTESAFGYLLRLSAVNGYSTPWSLCMLAGLRQHEVRTAGFDAEKLAQLGNRPFKEVGGLGFSATPDHPRWARLLGHPIVPAELNLNHTSFCPQCVQEKGYVEAHWHLRLMVVCPIHLRPVLSKCPVCNRTMTWYRPGLLECSCGRNLLQDDRADLRRDEVGVLEALRCKVLSEAPDEERLRGFPVRDLIALDLRSLVAIVRVLGKYRAIADGCRDLNNLPYIVTAASRVLADWPANFEALLRDLGAGPLSEKNGAVGKQFNGVYRALTKNRAITRGHGEFLKAAFVDFAFNHWGHGYIDRKLAKAGPPVDSRFMMLSDFAARAGVQARTAARWLKAGVLPAERIQCGRSSRIIVEASAPEVIMKSPGKIMHTRAVGKATGIPVSVLVLLRRSGTFEVKHLPKGYPGWHERDVAAFCSRLFAAPVASVADEPVKLGDVMKNPHLSPGIKADLLERLASGKMAGAVTGGDKPSNMLIASEAYTRFLIETRSSDMGNSLSSVEAAQRLHCDRGAVAGLVAMGCVRGVKTPLGLRIAGDSVTEFAGQYVSLAFHASRLGTSTRALMRRYQRNGTESLNVPVRRKAGPQPFVKIADIHADHGQLQKCDF